MNTKKLTPFDAIAELDSISIPVEQISDMFNIVLNTLEDECPAIGCREEVGATESIYFTKRFPKFYSALDFLSISLIDLVSRINKTVEELCARLREEDEGEKKPVDLTAEILSTFAQLTPENMEKAVAMAHQLAGGRKEHNAA